MNRCLALLAGLLLVLGPVGVAAAADDSLEHSGRLVFVAGGDVSIPASDQADAVVVLGGDATVEGTVNTLVVVDGTATVSDATLETVVLVNSSAELGDGTTVSGDVLRFGSNVRQVGDVEIGGQVRELTGDVAAFGLFLGAAAIILWLGFIVATLLVGLVVAALAARQVHAATTLISREPGLTFVVGLLAVIVPPILAVLAFATIIGIPAGIGFLVVVWPAVAFIGYLVAAVWIGEWLLYRRNPDPDPSRRPYAAILLGLAVGFVVGLIPVVTAVISIFGLGAVVLGAWRTFRGRPTSAQPLVTDPAPAA